MALELFPFLVCGDRDWTDAKLLGRVLDEFVAGLEEERYWPLLVTGGAPGADTLAEDWACDKGISRCVIMAPWRVYGRRAGPWRNRQMAEWGHVNHVIAFHDYIVGSKGTKDMLKVAKKLGITHELITHTEKARSKAMPARPVKPLGPRRR